MERTIDSDITISQFVNESIVESDEKQKYVISVDNVFERMKGHISCYEFSTEDLFEFYAKSNIRTLLNQKGYASIDNAGHYVSPNKLKSPTLISRIVDNRAQDIENRRVNVAKLIKILNKSKKEDDVIDKQIKFNTDGSYEEERSVEWFIDEFIKEYELA